jgi:amidase
MTEAHELTATEGLTAMEAGNLTAEGWLASCFERIDARDDAVLAWEYLDRAGALKRAQAVDKVGSGGLVAGMPFGVKDIIDTADMPTSYGTPIHAGHRPGRDAGCVAITRGAGAVLLGKTVSTEFGHKFPGKTRNPFNPAHTPGGSSSGSAAAVGDKMIPVAYGTQTTGSVIRPAAFCGTVGYKPTYGDFNNNGVMANTPTIDTLGMMVRSVEDLALMRSVLMEQSLSPLKPPAIGDLKVGFYRSPFWDQADADMQAHMERAAKKLSQMGATVSDMALPGIDADFEHLHGLISGFEFCRTVSWERFNRLDELSAALREGRMKQGLGTTYEEYRACTMILERLRL